jgi:hypothetical protein
LNRYAFHDDFSCEHLKTMIPLRFLLPALILFPGFGIDLFAFDPDDETFDPTVATVIADGATRIGDPSPVYREGVAERGFTHVGFSKTAEGVVTIQLSFIVPPDPDKPFFAALWLSPEQATTIAGHFRNGAALSSETKLLEVPGMGTWTLAWDGKTNLRVKNQHPESGGVFLLSLPAAKKLAGALEHSVEASAK